MTYTTQQLQGMSNHEINCALAVKLNVDHYTATGLLFTAKKHDGDNVISVSGVTDYCNNPSDIMPLAFERGISLNQSDCFGCLSNNVSGKWTASKSVSASDCGFIEWCGEVFSHDNPLRAIACLLLMMED